MCLTGLDYFGSLGYAPGIAALAAGVLAPSATLVLVFLTLFGALPMYKIVAEKSPHGQGSIAMLAGLIPGWWGKVLILCLIGFAATDFIITITLSAADAAAHIAQNSYVRELCQASHFWTFLQDKMGVTFGLLLVLSAVFMLGFKEAIGMAVVVVGSYMLLTAGVEIVACYQVAIKPDAFGHWQSQLFNIYKTPLNMTLQSLVLFPQLALGLSGFETGVAVMPLVSGDPSDTEEAPIGRIRNTRKLLTAAAVIMSLFLLVSSIVTTLLIPPEAFRGGGEANGRALAYLAHHYLGSIYGTAYDVATIFILWFSGASSLAGLLSLVPRYLPRFGMAPAWARATRPLVIFFSLVSFVVTYIFKANVDAQGGAYATGVLVLMSSAAFAVLLSLPRQNWSGRTMYTVVSLIFAYTTVMNIKERPEGLHIAAFFILAIFLISFISRVSRSTELRTRNIKFDAFAEKIVDSLHGEAVFVVAHQPGMHDYAQCAQKARDEHHLQEMPFLFLEVTVTDASEFSEDGLLVEGLEEEGFCILRCRSAAVPNAIASLLLALRNRTGVVPHAFMYWTEGNPIVYVLKYLFLGDGETAPVTREILREVEPLIERRPKIHVV
ncbi:MAG: amino acid transporter [Cyanobacteria bacterium REEB67]|nr:amino acid transporter [Cyanobacteria bacterium REEB67]